jgi:hypothetical protein
LYIGHKSDMELDFTSRNSPLSPFEDPPHGP